jgi:hypothetical protein
MRSKRIPVLGVLLAVFGVALGGAGETSFGQGAPLPPGHPPIGGSAPHETIPAPPPGGGTGGDGLTWQSPAGWTKETPASSMRRAQYRIPGAGGPGECAVFYFGPGQGGDAKANAERWAGQFRRPDGSPVGDAFKTREIKVGDIPVLMVEVAGTYVGGMGGGPAGPERPNYMLLGAIAKGPDANWFFRATGPRTTIEGQRAAFERMIRSLKRGQPL